MLALLTSMRVLHRQPGKVVRLCGELPVKLLGQLAIVDHDQPAFHGRAELRFVRLLKLLVGHVELIGRAASAGRASARGCRACTAPR